MGVGAVGCPDLRARHVLAVAARETEIARGIFEPMPTHIRSSQPEAPNRMLRVNHLPAGHAPAQKRLGSLAAVEHVGFEARLGRIPTKGETYAEPSRALREERQVKAEDIVVLEC